MAEEGIHTGTAWSSRWRLAGIMTVLAMLATVLALALTIPFFYETQTLWYKFGRARTILRTGQMFGLAAAVFLHVQLLLAARLPFLDRLIGLDRLYLLHRFGGVTVLVLAVTHASLVLLPEGLRNLPIGKKYWPEMVGMSLLLLVIILVSSGLFRKKLGIPYSFWRRLHRPLGYTALLLALVHVLSVSDAFAKGVPRYAICLLAGTVLAGSVAGKLRRLWLNRRLAEVSEVVSLTDSLVRLSVRLSRNRSFGYLPGQFAFLSLHGEVSKEPHPFTIASAPAQSGPLQFVIKKCGDWTEGLDRVKAGDKLRIDGPYGLFSHLARAGSAEVILIAGGIGITPMLSMLRQMALTADSRRVTLIWSIRGEEEMFFADELPELAARLPRLHHHLVYTRSRRGARRLDLDRLKQFTTGCDRASVIFICGPEQMMKRAYRCCLALGFSSVNIFRETFGL